MALASLDVERGVLCSLGSARAGRSVTFIRNHSRCTSDPLSPRRPQPPSLCRLKSRSGAWTEGSTLVFVPPANHKPCHHTTNMYRAPDPRRGPEENPASTEHMPKAACPLLQARPQPCMHVHAMCACMHARWGGGDQAVHACMHTSAWCACAAAAVRAHGRSRGR